jgi:hypothetical protein
MVKIDLKKMETWLENQSMLSEETRKEILKEVKNYVKGKEMDVKEEYRAKTIIELYKNA